MTGRPIPDQLAPTRPNAGLAAGVRVVIDRDPLAAAAQLAVDIGAEVLHDPPACEAAIRLRLDAAACDPAAALQEAERLAGLVDRHDPEEDAELAATLATQRAAARYVSPSDDDIRVLERLAERLASHARIRHRTERSASARLTEALQTTDRIVIHPESLRAAAAEVLAAEHAVHRARLIAEEGWPFGGPDDHGLREAAEAQAESAPHPRNEGVRSGAIPAAVLVLATGLAVAVAVLASPAQRGLALLPAGLAVVAAIVVARRRVTRARAERADRRAAAENLARASVLADEGLRRSPLRSVPAAEQDARNRELAAAKRQLASARRIWESLAGEDANPHDIDGVLQAHDPQQSIGPVVAAATSASRAAAAVYRRTRAAWAVSWAAMGRPAPNLEAADLALATLRRAADTGSRTIDLTAGERLAAAEAAAARVRARARLTQLLSHWSLDELRAVSQKPTARPSRTVILVEPFRGLPARRSRLLRKHLSQLPDAAEVVVVVRQAEDLPDLADVTTQP